MLRVTCLSNVLFECSVVFLPVETGLPQVDGVGKQVNNGSTILNARHRLRSFTTNECTDEEPAVMFEVCASNVLRDNVLNGDQSEKVRSSHQAAAWVDVVGKISKAGAQLVVVLDEGYASRVDSLAGQGHTLKTLWYSAFDNVVK